MTEQSPPPPPRPPYELCRLADIAPTPTDDSWGFSIEGEWRQLRHHFGMRELSANAFTATATGQAIVHEHVEQANDDPSQPGDEELYVVLSGRVRVRLGDEHVEAGAGTCVFVGDPATVRSFTALEAGTTVLTVGTNPGVRFVVSAFEQAVSPPPRWT
jgi:mannose-6-phosphate isomerase-like protein (cupin superfamily)